MKIIADLHIHSKFSRATSKDMDIQHLSTGAKQKGINLIGTGDFTHPLWFNELKSKLEKDSETGFYKHNGIFFVPSAEISSIYSQDGKCRKVHNVIIAPELEIVAQINEALGKRGRVDYDGRPIFGIPSYEVVEMVMGISKDCLVIPAHIWTPWFSLFGSNSGFDRIEDCYKDQTKNIFALETGLSSDPAMNWRLSQLDRFSLVSNSDCHSPTPLRLGREANVFEIKSYKEMFEALKHKDPKKFLYTMEVDPSYGKYHFDGHRGCNVCFNPEESKKFNNTCPKCGKPLTLGVLHRVEELADRPEGFVPKNAIPFKSVLPLQEVIANALGLTLISKKIGIVYEKMIANLGSELNIIFDAPAEKISEVAEQKIVDAILLNREGKIKVEPGYDGVYGIPIFNGSTKEKKKFVSLTDF